MGISHSEFMEMQRRTETARGVNQIVVAPEQAATREVGKGGLQQQILDYCDKQWPKWPVRCPRSDKPTTDKVGVNDMVIYAPNGRVLNIECKAKGNKPTQEQLQWAAQLKMTGHTVYFVWSFQEFLVIAATSA